MPRGPERVLDEYLVVSSQTGSRAALDLLVKRWTPRLLRFSARSLGAIEPARDVVQDVWASAVRNIGGLTDPARFPAWIYSIAVRKCADAIRRHVRQRRSEQTLASEHALNGHVVDPACLAGDRLDLSGALRRLSPEQRLVVGLFYSDELAVEEIAMALGIPAGTVKSRLHHARQNLKQHLEGAPNDKSR
jgi:RNA polymerase sigma-70 factor, ECF subfamily